MRAYVFCRNHPHQSITDEECDELIEQASLNDQAWRFEAGWIGKEDGEGNEPCNFLIIEDKQ